MRNFAGKRRMALRILGLNHRTAPVQVREQLAMNSQQLPTALDELVRMPHVDEMLIVSTCNRTELYSACDSPAMGKLRGWLMDDARLGPNGSDLLYIHEDQHAVNHTFSVASGLDSAVLGEPQILGQMKQAYRIATEVGSTGPMLHSLFQQAFAVAKLVRTDTSIGNSAVSVAYAAVTLARQIFADFSRHSALLVGAGETIELTARHLAQRGVRRMIIANRSLDRAQALAEEFTGYAITLDDIPAHLADADMLICSTASPEPLIQVAEVKAALKTLKLKPMFVVDLAVPRDVHPDVGKLEDIYLYTVDDLEGVISENLRSREEAARQAREIIDTEVARFSASLRTRDSAPTIREVRQHAAGIQAQVERQATRMLESGKSPEEVVAYLSRTLTNKLLHGPSAGLRRAGETGDGDLIQAARRLFGLPDDDA